MIERYAKFFDADSRIKKLGTYGKPPLEFGKLIAEIRRVGVNLNQIARSINAKGFKNSSELQQALDDLYELEHKLNESVCAKCEVLF